MASRSSVIGALGLGKQTAKGTVASTFHWIPATSLNLNAQQQTQTYAPEIGGSHFLRGSYKAGVSAGGDIGIQVRPDSIGYLLHMLCGQVTTVANSAAPTIANPASAPVPTAGAGSTSLPAGTYTVGYTFINGTGESKLSPTATVVLTAGQQISLAAITLGTATGVNVYFSTQVGSTNLGFAVTSATGTGIVVTALGNGLQVPPAANSTGGASDGSYTHSFMPFVPSASADLPWYSAIKDVSKLYWEQFIDTKLSSLRFDVSKQSLVTGSAGFFGITPQELNGSALTETMDSTSVFQACIATINLVDETGAIALTSNDVKPERLSFDFGNQLSQDEYTVGSYVPADITLLQRSAQISYDVVIRDPDLRRAVYQNGLAPAGAGSTADWSPKVFRGSLTLTMTTNDNVGLSANPYSLSLVFPGIDFLMMPVQLSGSQLIRANLSAQVTLGVSGTDTYRFILTNGVSAY